MKAKFALLILCHAMLSFANAQTDTTAATDKIEPLPVTQPQPKPRSNDKPVSMAATEFHSISNWVVLNIGGGISTTAGGWNNRYPNFFGGQFGAEYQHQEKFTVGFNYIPYSGSYVNSDSLFGGIQGPTGYVLDQYGYTSIIRTYLRGFNLTANVGLIKPFKTTSAATHSLVYTAGLGYHEHYTRFQFDKGRIPQIEGSYDQGYDNYRRGIAVTESVKYQYINNEAICVFAGINLLQSVTSPQRAWDFATDRAPDKSQFDFSIGLNMGFIIPINADNSNNKAKTDYYF